MATETTGLIAHLEHHLGEISFGVSDPDGKRMPFQIVAFESGPIAGTNVLSTLGLSRHNLTLSDGRLIRMELVMLYRDVDGPRNLAGILHQVGSQALEHHHAYSRGEVIVRRGEVVPGSNKSALYVASPVYLPDSFHVFRPPHGEPILIAWLVPLSIEEARVAQQGSEAFEDLLVERNPDLLDFDRASIV